MDSNTTPSTPTAPALGFPVVADKAIHRVPVRPDDSCVATVTFRGQIDDATTDLWVETGARGGGINLYAEVRVDDTTATEVTVAVVRTGSAVPGLQGSGPFGTGVGAVASALRLGSAANGRVHVYLLGVDGTADRAAFEQWVEDRKAERQAARDAAALAQQVNAIFDGDDEDGDGS